MTGREAYTIDAVSLLHYLLDILPVRADDLVERAEAGEVVIDAPFIAVVETLYTIDNRDGIRGVPIALTPLEALEKITDESPIRIRGEDPTTLPTVVSLIGDLTIHDAMIVASHRAHGTEGVITTDTEIDALGVPVIWD